MVDFSKAAESLPDYDKRKLTKIQEDLNSEFPFAALWQDGEVNGGIGKLLPVISIIIDVIMLVLVILILAKK